MQEMPRGLERRLVLRLLHHWRDLCGERRFPSFDEVDPAQIPDMWPSCFVLDAHGHRDDPVFRLVGDDIAKQVRGTLVDLRVSQVPRDTLVDHAVSYLDEVIAKEVPISRGGQFLRTDGVNVLYRSILLPMSDDGDLVSGILGAANCREVEG
jgi:hypothetical protein